MFLDSPTTITVDGEAPALCPICGHPDAAHDMISRRWCAVTASSAGTRACICSGDLQAARSLNHY